MIILGIFIGAFVFGLLLLFFGVVSEMKHKDIVRDYYREKDSDKRKI